MSLSPVPLTRQTAYCDGNQEQMEAKEKQASLEKVGTYEIQEDKNNNKYLVVACPGCQEFMCIYLVDLRCGSVRHAVDKRTGKSLYTSCTSKKLEQKIQQNKISGCGASFAFEQISLSRYKMIPKTGPINLSTEVKTQPDKKTQAETKTETKTDEKTET